MYVHKRIIHFNMCPISFAHGTAEECLKNQPGTQNEVTSHCHVSSPLNRSGLYQNHTFNVYMGPGVAWWLRHCATSRRVSGSIPSGVAGDFFRGYRRNHVSWDRLSL
jgi:hypothetical protein